MAVAQSERAYRKYAWVLLIPGGIIGLIPLFSTPPERHPYDFIIGPLIWGMGIVQLVVGFTLFRKGNRWGWYLILLAWLVALVNGIYDVIVGSLSLGISTFFFFGGPALLALLLTYQNFFPKKQILAA